MKHKELKLEVSATEIRNILSQYIPNELTDTEEVYNIKKAMQKLDKSDLIIYTLYLELQSERKTAQLLGISRTPLHSIVARVKNEIIEHINEDKDGND